MKSFMYSFAATTGVILLMAGLISGCNEGSNPVTIETGSSDALAKGKPGGGGGGGDSCALKFDLEVVAFAGAGVLTDGGGVGDDGIYRDGTDKVLVFTGKSGDGWRFDTNSSKKTAARQLVVNDEILDSDGDMVSDITGVSPGLRTIDMRFVPRELNLCEMDVTLPNESYIGVSLGFKSGNSLYPDGIAIRYDEDACGGTAESKMKVTHTAGTDTWTFEGSEACLIAGNPDSDPVSGLFDLPFRFVLTAQP